MKGIDLITKEREEQIRLHGRSIQMDVLYNTEGQLIEMAHDLLLSDSERDELLKGLEGESEVPWIKGWDINTYKSLMLKPYRERKVTAAALIAADLDREDYLDNNLIKDEKSN